MALLKWLNFLLGSLTLTLKVLFFGFISLGATICYFFLWKILIMFFYRFQWLSFKLKGGCPYSLHSLWLFLCCLGRSLWSWEMLYERTYLNLVLLLPLLNFVSGSSLKLMCISLTINISSNLTHLHGFQLLLLLP